MRHNQVDPQASRASQQRRRKCIRLAGHAPPADRKIEAHVLDIGTVRQTSQVTFVAVEKCNRVSDLPGQIVDARLAHADIEARDRSTWPVRVARDLRLPAPEGHIRREAAAAQEGVGIERGASSA